MPDIKSTTNQPVVLLILDGWGMAQAGSGNAVSLAVTPNFNKLVSSYPHAQLIASGEAVGLPREEAGNTETGHLNIGAGRIVYQDIERINMSIADGSFFTNRILLAAIEHAKKFKSNLHLMGLIGAAGVHANTEHLFALIKLVKDASFPNLFLHLFTDGRDSPPTSSISYLTRVNEYLKSAGVGQVASIMGRYWAMDRDQRWERTEAAYKALTEGVGALVKSPNEAVELSYSEGKTDEFIPPSLIANSNGSPIALLKDNDAVIFYNFRIDRPRQLTAAFLVKDFRDDSLSLDFDPYLEKYQKTNLASHLQDGRKVFTRQVLLTNLFFVTMTQYCESLVKAGTIVAFPPEKIDLPLSRVVSEAGLKQLKMAESEKERFVTFYLNGQKEEVYNGEDRIIIPSKSVGTYDQAPEMGAFQITSKLLEEFKSQEKYSLYIVNLANADMVAHTGNIGPAVKACEAVDDCLGQIANYLLAYGGTLIVTADHGNAEEMINLKTGQVDTEHSSNPVPFIVVRKNLLSKNLKYNSGILADIAPTILALLGLPVPTSMTGRNLLEGI